MNFRLLEEFAHDLTALQNETQLASFLAHAARRMGFDHFALSYDQWSGNKSDANLLLHDYPESWARVYVHFDLGRSDPVRRGCENCLTGFAWGDLSRHITLTKADQRMLLVGRENGISDGYTVPRHLPGRANGSCTFAVGQGKALPANMLVVAEHVGAAALATAKRLVGLARSKERPRLSDRQRECVLLSACGKTAGEIGGILGIAEATAIQHLRAARERYNVHCSETLILCALFDGLIGFGDVFPYLSVH